ncbi:hypothetical protein TVAG_121690 [Trichomonas vaginalis G3]|uniref:Uncharacterized protein n=1 Tax=Trichomonas vaginalis (strain ATCC PRA-98 / G3) TaxID=412133 RepID=A2E980_TRIV3|nr:hypothetical protein TVAGG3_0421540 [Trichomonas vaginalis G3]EAY10765.1 hypothetical protein TVAG_121690 [Trichomonas vaginalis G3]KAI5536097.1 hypothetical protein TVAGG3_0421540 [Trichomonas vaginalis G3]|eukprot:XP_001322988.1 hypothetical protein [Trichomonas vaginalis G3]
MEIRPQITNEDLGKIVELFSQAISESIGDDQKINLDQNKVNIQFENALRQNLTIIQTPEEEIKGQQIKCQIEKMQQQAIRLQQQILGRKNAFVNTVRTMIDQYLDELIPDTPEIDIDQPIQFPPEVNELFTKLDEQIDSLEQQVKRSSMEKTINQLSPFIQSTMNFLNEYEKN